MLRLGAEPSNIAGVELNETRLNLAGKRLPDTVDLSLNLDLNDTTFDVVILFTVLSSIVDQATRRSVAQSLWGRVRKGSLIFVYDFKFNNPKNSNVSKVTYREIFDYFPGREHSFEKVVLAPPIARRVYPKSWFFGQCLNGMPFLRSHFVCCVKK